MKKIKIFEVITTLELGGAQLSTIDLVRSLDRERYDLSLVTGKEGRLFDDAALMRGLAIVAVPSLKRCIHPYCDAVAFFALYRLFKKEKPDIVHTHSSKAGILGRWAARCAGVTTIIHTVHGWPFHAYQYILIRWFYMLLEKMTAFITDEIICVTQHDIDEALRYGVAHKGKFRLIRYGIDRNRFRLNYNGLFRKELGIDSQAFLVGMIACFKPQKAPLDFVRSAKMIADRIPAAHFVMVGDGVLRREIIRMIKQLGLKDKFFLVGWRRDIPELLSSFDVLVLTSLWEGLPIVLLEAMASAKPIVATDICGNREIVKNDVNGFLVEPKSHESFAERIIELHRNTSLAERIGSQAASSLGKEYDSAHMVSFIDETYQKYCKGNRN